MQTSVYSKAAVYINRLHESLKWFTDSLFTQTYSPELLPLSFIKASLPFFRICLSHLAKLTKLNIFSVKTDSQESPKNPHQLTPYPPQQPPTPNTKMLMWKGTENQQNPNNRENQDTRGMYSETHWKNRVGFRDLATQLSQQNKKTEQNRTERERET